jgi:hypothetical protein
MTSRPCPECDQPLPRAGYAGAVLAVEVLDVRDRLAALDPSAVKLGFCDRGVALASAIHASAHRSGTMPFRHRKAKRWLREADQRLGIWRTARRPAPVRQASMSEAG